MKKIKYSQAKTKKCKIIIIDGDWIFSGNGTYEGKKIDSIAVFTATLVKEIPTHDK